MEAPNEMIYTRWNSPVGPLLLARDARGLRAIQFLRGRRHARIGRGWRRDDEAFVDVIEQLRAYFAGTLCRFHLRLAPEGTPFQQRVWAALAAIPYGCTVSYGEVARRVGSPRAARAVGAANHRNPLPIVIPCHRVIGADGTLTGYGGGLAIKQALLALEQRHSR